MGDPKGAPLANHPKCLNLFLIISINFNLCSKCRQKLERINNHQFHLQIIHLIPSVSAFGIPRAPYTANTTSHPIP